MFAIFLSDAMDPFYANITSFPTVVFSFLLVLCFLFWCLAALGMVDLDFLNFDIPDSDLDANLDHSNLNVLAGLMLRLGLNAVPTPIIVSIMSLLGWLICYYAVDFIFPLVPGALLEFLIGIPILLVTLLASAKLTALIIKPLKPFFKAADQQVEKHIIGQVGLVRTAKVNQNFGEASVEDGGAGLIVKVRSFEGSEFVRGDRIVLLEYLAEEHAYRVISEAEFKN